MMKSALRLTIPTDMVFHIFVSCRRTKTVAASKRKQHSSKHASAPNPRRRNGAARRRRSARRPSGGGGSEAEERRGCEGGGRAATFGSSCAGRSSSPTTASLTHSNRALAENGSSLQRHRVPLLRQPRGAGNQQYPCPQSSREGRAAAIGSRPQHEPVSTSPDNLGFVVWQQKCVRTAVFHTHRSSSF